MKVKQVVGEHKKGFRAKKYASKPKKYIEPVKPTSTATKPQGVSEGDDPLQNRADYAKKHGQGQVYKKTYPGDKVGMTKTYAYDVKRTGPKGQLPKEDLELEENNPIGVVSNVTPDGKQVTIKKTDGTELKTTGDAVLPGPDGKTASIAPGAGNELKPGTPVTSGQTLETSEESLGTMPTTEYVKGIYAAAAENGMDAPEVEAVKKQMVLAPNGEVDIMKTMQKALQVFQSPEWKQMLADLDALVKKAEAQPQSNLELARIQELAGMQEEADGGGEQPPPMPDISGLQAGQTKNLGDGQRVTVNQDGTVSYSGGFGVYTYDNTGAAIDYKSPSFSGLSQSKNLKTGQTSQRYLAGPMDVSQTKDASGKVINTKARYDMGTGVLGGEQEKGITTKSWTPRSADFDPVSQKDLYAMGNADKAATYDRAMRQVQQTNESSELDAMLRIAGLK